MVIKRFLLGILAVALIFGMTVVGCKDGSKDDDSKDKNGGDKEDGFTLTDIPATYIWKICLF
jgi:hypothetical protein